MQTQRFHSLDLFRGIAALTVALGHFIIDGIIAPDGQIPQAHEAGIIWNFSFIYAVDFFLVLSGFVLAHSYLHRMEITFRDFALRRFFRMYPLHLLTLLVTLGLFALFGLSAETKDILLHVFFIQNMGLGPDSLTLNIPSWTISIEFWINIAAFILLLVIRPNKRIVQILLLVIACVCFALLYKFSGHLDVNQQTSMGFLNWGLLRCSGAFILGFLTYRLYLRCQSWQPAAWLVGLAILSFLAIILALPGHALAGFATPFVFCGIVLVLACSDHMTRGVSQPLVLLGDISFSIYLVHDPILRCFRETGLEKSLLTGLGFLAVVLIISTLTYKLFERPVYRWSLSKTARFRRAAPA